MHSPEILKRLNEQAAERCVGCQRPRVEVRGQVLHTVTRFGREHRFCRDCLAEGKAA